MSWKVGSISIEFSAESREYMLTNFWGMGTYIYWGDGSKSLGGMNLPSGFAPLFKSDCP